MASSDVKLNYEFEEHPYQEGRRFSRVFPLGGWGQWHTCPHVTNGAVSCGLTHHRVTSGVHLALKCRIGMRNRKQKIHTCQHTTCRGKFSHAFENSMHGSIRLIFSSISIIQDMIYLVTNITQSHLGMVAATPEVPLPPFGYSPLTRGWCSHPHPPI